MDESANPAPSPPKPRKRWLPRLRFSLRTLVIGVMLVGSAGGLWWRWQPWALTNAFHSDEPAATRPPAFLRNGRFIIFGNGSSRAYDTHAGDWFLPDRVTFSADGSRFVQTQSKGFSVWDARSRSFLSESNAEFLDISPDGRWIHAHSEDGWPLILDAATCKIVHDFSSNSQDGGVQTIADRPGPDEKSGGFDLDAVSDCFSADSTRMIIVLHGALTLVDVFTGAIIAVLPGSCARFSPDSRYVCTEAKEIGETSVFDTKDGKQLATFAGHSARFVNQRIVVVTGGRSHGAFDKPEPTIIHVSETTSGRSLYKLPYMPDDRRFRLGLVACGKRMVLSVMAHSYKWDADTGENCKYTAQNTVVSPSGQRILTWRTQSQPNNQDLEIWDADSELQLCVLHSRDFSIEAAAMSDDGLQIVTEDRCGDNVRIFHRRRPEYWWGVAWLPEFWLTALFAVMMVWSGWRDRKAAPNLAQLTGTAR